MSDEARSAAGAGVKKRASRLPFLDWTRGLAAFIMLQGHTFHSFLRPELRDTGTYIISQFVGGIAPAIFLFLTGVTLAFLMHRLERQRLPRIDRVIAALRRAGYLFALAFAFRFQLWLFAWPQSPWTDLLRVDILNCMGVGLAAVACLAALTNEQRVHAGVVVGLLIACAAPLIPSPDPNSTPNLLQAYFAPDYRYFSFFPWASFVGFGVSGGAILRQVPTTESVYMHRTMQWAAIIGFGLVISAQYFSNLPYSLYSSTDFWLNSPGLVLIKVGIILLLLSLAFLWTHHGAGQGWSWVRLLGTNSLLVYWVHIELVYGRWFGYWKERLTLTQCAIASLVLIMAMIGLAE
ncbi:MAG TPA: heparan-alpha-glucosaminide N-acetyltransferase domain-containing protein, partial [Bryobacteraceae bacterium]|nr:heparan-alpha-glucosaminide N-acetyltransferase domain-containing protein [Bryobacteraceae bacterium]